MIEIQSNIDSVLAELELMPKEAEKLQKALARRLSTLTHREIVKAMKQVLLDPAIKIRIRRSQRYAAIYGYANPVTIGRTRNPQIKSEYFPIRGILFERTSDGIRPVRVPIQDEVESSFTDAQRFIESQWEQTDALIEHELDKILSK